MKNRKILHFSALAIFILCLIISCLYVYKNTPLRTAIYRSFAKQTVYLYSEADTIYSFGYFGVRKQLIDKENGNIKLLKANDDFCSNCFVGHLIGRSGVIKGDYLYVAARSYLGGRYKSSNQNYLKGKLLVMHKNDLNIIKEVPADYSMIEAKIHNNNLVLSGLQGFNIYDISDASNPKLSYQYRTEKAYEYQGCDFFDTDSCQYLVFARFDCGLSIYNISNPKSPELVKDILIQDTLSNGVVLPKGLQSFKLIIKYPYIISTLAPTKNTFGTNSDLRGIWVCDISNLNQIKKYAILIPKNEYYSIVTGDPQPSHIAIHKDEIYTNFCEKGIAKFSISESPFSIRFIETINFANGKKILPILIDNEGWLFAGSFDNEKIYAYKLN